MTEAKPAILIYGYGNPGRQDDGAGVLLAEAIEKWSSENSISQVEVDSDYQLNLEDALTVSRYETVVFADASHENITDFLFESVEPSAEVEFTMHAVSPRFILHLCNQVFGCTPKAYLLHIKGYAWEFMANVTPEAIQNIEKASAYLKDFILGKITGK